MEFVEYNVAGPHSFHFFYSKPKKRITEGDPMETAGTKPNRLLLLRFKLLPALPWWWLLLLLYSLSEGAKDDASEAVSSLSCSSAAAVSSVSNTADAKFSNKQMSAPPSYDADKQPSPVKSKVKVTVEALRMSRTRVVHRPRPCKKPLPSCDQAKLPC